MISEFIDEVTSTGIDGILPKNLDEKWFRLLLDASVEYLQIVLKEEKTDPETFLNNEKGMLLMAAVAELLQHRYDYPAHFQINSVPKEHLFDSASCYAIAIVMDLGRRTRGFELPEIDSETILETDMITEIESGNPVLSNFLNEVVIGTIKE